MRTTPRLLKWMLNLYPPNIGAGIRITRISDDWREAQVRLRCRWYNRNAIGTHFGGSLFAMIDPQYMLMLIGLIGRDYIVVDKAASIEFIKATRRTVTARFLIDDVLLEDIRRHTEDGEKYLPVLPVEIRDDQGELIARAEKTLYIRCKNRQD